MPEESIIPAKLVIGVIYFLVPLLNYGNISKYSSDFRESLFVRNLRKTRIHLGVLVMFAGCGGEEIVFRLAY